MITLLEWLERYLCDLLWQPSLEMALFATSLTYDWDANQLLLGAWTKPQEGFNNLLIWAWQN